MFISTFSVNIFMQSTKHPLYKRKLGPPVRFTHTLMTAIGPPFFSCGVKTVAQI